MLPLALLPVIIPSRFRCAAYSMPPGGAPTRFISPAEAVLRADKLHAGGALSLGGAFALGGSRLSGALSTLAEEAALIGRALYLAALFTPALLAAPLVVYLGLGRPAWVELVRWTLERAGPAFIKWGQWAATRPDLFPKDFCRSLSSLQSSAPSHEGHMSVTAIERAFGRPLGDVFVSFEAEPIASGSIAQIHRARLSQAAASSAGAKAGMEVAVKVGGGRDMVGAAVQGLGTLLSSHAARLPAGWPACHPRTPPPL